MQVSDVSSWLIAGSTELLVSSAEAGLNKHLQRAERPCSEPRMRIAVNRRASEDAPATAALHRWTRGDFRAKGERH